MYEEAEWEALKRDAHRVFAASLKGLRKRSIFAALQISVTDFW